MSYDSKNVLLDAGRKPIPQYFNETEDSYQPVLGKYGAANFMQKGTIAEEAWNGTANITKTFTAARYGFSIVNDGDKDLTFTINGNTRIVKPNEPYYALFNMFTSVSIVTTTPYRAEVLS